jgi:hypothetical protein
MVQICTLEVKIRIENGKSRIQREEDYFRQQIGMKFKEKTSEVLHLEHSIVWC